MENELPDKPSELIRVALKDLDLCMVDPTYEINFTNWYRVVNVRDKDQFGKPALKICEVCFAGAVMAKSLNAPSTTRACPSDFEEETEAKLEALDAFRTGAIHIGLENMAIEAPKEIRHNMNAQQDDYVQFKADMEKIIIELEKFNL